MDRKSALLSLFDPAGLGLEIGPSFNPLFPKSEGYDVEILDHLPADQLRVKYAGVTAGVDRIEEVDYVWSGEPLSELIGSVNRYSYIVASHVIEHTTDLLGFLIECEKLLQPSGVLVLAIPDKRFAFDVLRPRASVGDVLQAYLDQRTIHSPGKIFDEVAYNVLRAGQPSWPRTANGKLEFCLIAVRESRIRCSPGSAFFCRHSRLAVYPIGFSPDDRRSLRLSFFGAARESVSRRRCS